MEPRVVVIGGGSAYMPGVAFAFAHAGPTFAQATLVLQDIDSEALELQGRLTANILRSRGASEVRVEIHRDRVRALEGADLVLAAFRPGGLAARHLDEQIAIEHGVIGQETAGPGGFAMALRSVPVVVAIAEELHRVGNEGATLLDYTNPVQIVSEAVHRFAPRVPYVGLCDQTEGERRFLGRLMGCAPASIDLDTCGVNHMTFTQAIHIDGRDETVAVWARLDSVEPDSLDAESERRIVRLFRMLGQIPSEYMQYFLFHDEVLAEQRTAGTTRAQEVMALLPGVLASYREQADREHPQPSMARASEEHGDFAVSVMSAMRSTEPARFILNLPNRGQVGDLPADAVVETPAMVHGGIVEPIDQGSLPPEVSGMVRQVVAHAQLAAEAAMTGSRALAVKALALHPLVRSVGTAEALVDAYLRAHAAHLPRFSA
ncbi:MAG TPA: glycoside hydrolase family 4 [Actinomycetota bacterium]